MRIQHNILAMNAYRNYNTNTSALAKNLEKLSSGYKINRAGDDAAGLAISEKMRAQITGLNAAQKNVKDGISLVKTAEGAMQEIQDMLNRMDYLATQSANGTYDNEVDRKNLQKEIVALKSEINRIAESANFNGIKLLDGTQSGGGGNADAFTDVTVTKEVDAVVPDVKTQKGEYSIDFKDFNFAAKSNVAANTELKIKVAGKTVATAKLGKTGGVITGADVKAVSGKVTIGDVKFNIGVDGTKITLKMDEDPKKDFNTTMKVTLSGVTAKTGIPGGATSALGNNGITDTVTVDKEAVFAPDRVYASAKFTLSGLKDGDQIKIGNQVYTFAIGKNSKYKSGGIDLTHLTETSGTLAKEAAQKLTQAAADNTMFKVTTTNSDGEVHLTEKEGAFNYKDPNLVNDLRGPDKDTLDGKWDGLVRKGNAATSGATSGGLTLQIGDTADTFNQLSVSIGSMKTGSIGIDGVDISTQAGAQNAIQAIKDAINNVSSVRGDLGAIQNRLEHTQKNLSVMAENIQDAESTIRDTDVAEEMMAYTKNNILIQSAQAMLAQANAVPQGVLQLLG